MDEWFEVLQRKYINLGGCIWPSPLLGFLKDTVVVSLPDRIGHFALCHHVPHSPMFSGTQSPSGLVPFP